MLDARRTVSERARSREIQTGEFELSILINIQTPLTDGHWKLRENGRGRGRGRGRASISSEFRGQEP